MADIEEKQLTQILEQSKKVVEDVEGKLKEKKIKKIEELKLEMALQSECDKKIITEIENLAVKCFDANKNKIEKYEILKELEDNTSTWSVNKVLEDEEFHRKKRGEIRNYFREVSQSLDYLKEALWSMSFLGNFQWSNKGFCGISWRNLVAEKIVWVEENDKINFLRGLLTGMDKTSLIIIFMETEDGVHEVDNYLLRSGFRSVSVHKHKSEREQNEAFQSFREFSTPILVTTNYILRWWGIPTAGTVINFDMPSDIEKYRERKRYVERIGKVISFFNGECSISDDLVDHLEENHQEVPRAIKSAAACTRRRKRQYNDE